MIKRKRYRRHRHKLPEYVVPGPYGGEDDIVVDGMRLLHEQIDGVGPWWWLWSGGRFESGSWCGPSREWPMLRDKVVPLLKGAQRVITAGGCQGMYPRLWAKHFREVIAFEPAPESFAVMQKNCEGEKFRLIQGALGDTKGKGNLYICGRENVGMHSIVRNNGNIVEVDVWRVDDLNLAGVDLIQLDIEGSEDRALKGAEETVRRFKPVLVLETVDGGTVDFLNRHGYDLSGQVVSDRIYMAKA